jgi:hypothetical protein
VSSVLTLASLAPLASLGLAAGCMGADTGDGPATPGPTIELRVATGLADPMMTGVAVDGDGHRFVFAEDAGLYELHGSALTLRLARDAMPDPGVPVRPPFTDLAALGDDRFALTAIGDGYFLDLGAATLRQYFCYVPDGLPEEYDQRTDAVAYDRAAGLIHAQPRTFDGGGNLIASQLASYSFQTGVDVDWFGLELDVAAGGMTMLPGVDGPVLADGTRLLARGDTGLVELDDLARLGVVDIAGLAVDETTRTLLVLDGANDRLLDVPLADLGR